ncbi:MAG: hypothetical protein LBS25_07450 [Candidatus Symbiothrix sp.]|nr:hypothetical protein [Candidatus Symbiothrix sp.]
MKKTIILAAAILLASTASADRSSFKDRTENWLQRENTDNKELQSLVTDETSSSDLRIGTPTPAPTVPVGSGLSLLLIIAGGYMLSIKSKQQKS